MKKIIIILFSIVMAGELEVDGDLKVTGKLVFPDSTIQSTAFTNLNVSRRGVSFITSTTQWTVPENVGSIFVELWGHGGSGAGNSSNGQSQGAGGAGGYVRGTIQVTPNEILTFSFEDETEVLRNETILAYANPGQNGNGAQGGSGGTAYIENGISINGSSGGNGGGGAGSTGPSGPSAVLCVFGGYGNGGRGGNGSQCCGWNGGGGGGGGGGAIYLEW